MQIAIKSSQELTTFAYKISDQSGKAIASNKLKTAMAKAYGYNHVKAFEAALNSNSVQTQVQDDENHDTASDELSVEIQKSYDSYCENIQENVLKLTDSDTIADLSMTNWEDAEDSIEQGAKAFANDDDLGKAIALLKQAGLNDMAANLFMMASSVKDLEFLKKTV